MDIQTILLIIGLIFAFLMAINIGGNDAANPTSPAVGAGALTLRRALLLFALFTVLGASLQGFMVMKTIGSGIVPQIDVMGAIAIIIGANIWILFATLKGMAISTGHSIIAAVIGYGVMKYSLAGLNISVIESIVVSWITSPICAMILAFILYRGISAYASKHQEDSKKLDRFFRIMLIIGLCFAAYSFGANDVSHATGVYLQITGNALGSPTMTTMFLLAVYGAIGIVIGGLTIGPKVIETLAYKVTRLDLTTALSATVGNALVVYLFATLPFLIWGYGLPISSSYAAVGGIIGAGLAKSIKSVSAKSSLKLVSYWVLTIPVNMALVAGIYFLLLQIV